MAAYMKKRSKYAISGFLRKIDEIESDEIQMQRYQFREFVKVLEKVNYFKGTKSGTDAYNKKLEGARVTFNKKFPDQQIPTIDILKFGYGKDKGVSSAKDQSTFNKIINNVLKIFQDFKIADRFDKFYSNKALITDGTTLQRITKESNWYTGFGTEYVKKGEMRKWKIKLSANENAAWFKAYIGICDVKKCQPKMEGPMSDTNNIQWSMHLYTGHKCHQSRDGKPYAKRVSRGKVVEMILNMKGKGKGTLKYIIDGKDYGIAFDNVDDRLAYKLAVSIQNRETYTLVKSLK